MEFPAREQIERRIQAMVADHLDSVSEDHPDGFDIGTIGLVFDVWSADTDYDGGFRADAEYFPPMEVNTALWYYVSDHRWWVKLALFTQAYEFFSARYSNENTGKRLTVDDLSEDEEDREDG